jgi:hypothetical protein
MQIVNDGISILSDDERQDFSLLKEIFDQYNGKCFDGILPTTVRLRWAEEILDSHRKSAVGASCTGYYDGKGDLDAPYLFVDRKFIGCDPILNLIILHEMCHHYIAYRLCTMCDGHNELFLKVLMEALAKLDWYPLLGASLPDFHVQC